MKRTSLRALSVLLALLILLPLSTTAIPIVRVAPVVKAASSATITLDKSQGYVGDYVTVKGRGFTPDKDVTFMWGDQLLSSLSFISGMPYFQRPSYDKPGEVFTDALGNFIVELQVPKLTRGTYTIKASDTETSAVASFTINPRIILRNDYAYEKHGKIATPVEPVSSQHYIGLFLAEGFVGDSLSVQLSGFARGEKVEVKMDTTTLEEFTVGTAEEGYKFDSGFGTVPDIPGGEKNMTATGKLSGIIAWTTFDIKPELFLAEPPPSVPPPPGLALAYPWLYSSDPFGLGWYSSVNTAVDSAFVFEATGLTGTSIQSVSVTHTGGTVTCTLSGTLTIQTNKGSTQGISGSTVPFASNTPFSATSPVAEISAELTSGDWLSVTIVTTGTGGASFTFTNQLFASKPATTDNAGTPFWIESDGTITANGAHLSATSGDTAEVAVAGLKTATSYTPTIIYQTGSTVRRLDFDALSGLSLTPFNQAVAPLAYYDANGNSVWDVGEDVYFDADNSGSVGIGPPADIRVTTVTIGATTYFAGSTVAAGNVDAGRALVNFEVGKGQPTYYDVGPYTGSQPVYLDKDNTGSVSQGDTRVSVFYFGFVGIVPDANGFMALDIGSISGIPGGGLEYNLGFWNPAASTYGVLAGTTVTLQVLARLEIVSTPISFQKQWYVTEGSSVSIVGSCFRGDEQLTISVGGKYVTTVTPNTAGSFSTSIPMPALPGGEQSITANGIVTADNTASASVTFTPALSVSPTTGTNLNPVTSIMVTGKGFEAGTYQIVFDGAGIGEAVTSAFTVTDTGDEAGQINIAFNLPAGVEGVHIVDVVKTSDPTKSALYGAGYFTIGAVVRTLATPAYPTDSEFPVVETNPSLQAAPSATTVGTSVAVTGKGLQPSTTYYIWYDPRGTSTSQAVLMTTTPATATTDAKGTLTASFQIPQSSGDAHSIWVSTSNTFINNDRVLGSPVTTGITIRPAITLAQPSGIVGADIAVSFTGLNIGTQYQLWWYKPNEPKFAGEIPSTALRIATATGALYGNSTEAVSFTVPATAEVGTVYAVDLSYYGDAGYRYTVLPNPVFFTVGKVATKITLGLTPTLVTQGENVTVNGVIEPALSVNITLYVEDPEGKTENSTITSTSSGTFTGTFIPGKPGTWQVWATWDGNTVYAEYTSLVATVTAKPIDFSWAYAMAGVGIGTVALVLGLIITLYYFMRKKRAPPPAT